MRGAGRAMRGTGWRWSVGLAALVACSSNPEPQQPLAAPAELTLEPVETEVEKAFARGLAALKLGNYPAATEEIGSVARSCATAPIGGRALLTLIAIELDPRNPDRDPEVARQSARRYLELSNKPAWTEPAIETLYLMALDMGGSEEEAGDAGEDGTTTGPAADSISQGGDPSATDVADVAPLSLHGSLVGCDPGNRELMVGALRMPTLPDEPVVERLASAEQGRIALQRRVARLEQELADLQQELARIRETLKP